MELSANEFAFAILIESHAIACRALFSLILAAVKVSNPVDWKKKICERFTAGIRSHVERCLESDRPFTEDTYVVCKLISCHINDIAKFCSGALSGPREKERLSLQAQGVLAARNVAFHGTFVSVGEVSSSVTLLLLILGRLGCDRIYLERLWVLVTHANNLVSLSSSKNVGGDKRFQFSFCTITLLRTLLYGGMALFQHLFGQLFKRPLDSSAYHDGDKNKDEDIFTLVKRIKGEFCKPKKESLISAEARSRKKFSNRTLLVNLEKIKRMRDRLAHNEPLAFSEVNEVLYWIADILELFALENEHFLTFITRASLLREDLENEIMSCSLRGSRHAYEEHGKCPFGSEERHRLLRPKSTLTVGRTQELSRIITTLTSDVCPAGKRVVLIFGTAGIGKSHLATNAGFALQCRYPKQAWVCCSSIYDICHDLSTNHYLSKYMSRHERSEAGNQVSFNTHQNTDWLIVLDDVSATTVDRIFETFVTTGYAVIITTRRTSVKEHLQRKLVSLTVINLRPFTAAESWHLVTCTIKRTTLSLQLSAIAKRAIKRVLGNLPLCVSIYSSLLAVFCKGNRVCCPYEIDSSSVLLNWENIEEKFGDRLHVRGMKGILQSAENYLENHPMASFLLTKISLANMETIPWKIVRNGPWQMFHQMQYLDQGCPWKHIQLQQILYNLHEVIDFLFSGHGQGILEECRGDLEELGLIGWDAERGDLRIHSLTLRGIQDLLAERNLYLGRLVAMVTGKKKEDDFVQRTSTIVSAGLKVGFLLDVLYRSVCLLLVPLGGNMTDESINEEEGYKLYVFLSKVIETLTPFNDTIRVTDFIIMRSQVFHSLTAFAFKFFIPVTEYELSCWIKRYQDCTTDECKSMKTWRSLLYSAHACRLSCDGRMSDSLSMNQEAVLNMVQVYGENSYEVANVHCQIAVDLEQTHGIHARDQYLLEASTTCPILADLPKREDIITVISDCKNIFNCESPLLVHRSIVWNYLIRVRIKFELKKHCCISTATKELVLLLITMCQQAQQTILEEVKTQTITSSIGKRRQVWTLNVLLFHAETEYQLHHNLQNHHIGLLLRSLLRVYQVVEAKISGLQVNVFDDDHSMFILKEVLGTNCSIVTFRVGNFSLARDLGLRVSTGIGPLDNLPNNSSKKIYLEESSSYTTLVFEGLFLVYVRRDFCQALATFFDTIDFLLPGRALKSTMIVEEVRKIAFNHFLCLCAFGGPEFRQQGLKKLETTQCNCNNALLMRELHSTATALTALNENYSFHSAYQWFIEARYAMQKNSHSSAKMASLKCWSKLTQATIPEELTAKRTTLEDIMSSLLLKLAEYLKIISEASSNHSIAEWFYQFRIQTARRQNWLFLADTFAMEYVKYIEGRERCLDALEQCYLLMRQLTEDFGDNYLQWLPGAPKAAFLCGALEERIAQQNIPEQS